MHPCFWHWLTVLTLSVSLLLAHCHHPVYAKLILKGFMQQSLMNTRTCIQLRHLMKVYMRISGILTDMTEIIVGTIDTNVCIYACALLYERLIDTVACIYECMLYLV